MSKIALFTVKLTFISIILLITTCIEDPPRITKLEIGSESNISGTTATVGAIFVDVSGHVTEFGFCWSTSSKPEVSDNKIINNGTARKGDFSNEISGLLTNTDY